MRQQLVNCFICNQEGRTVNMKEDAVPSGWSRIDWNLYFSGDFATQGHTNFTAVLCGNCSQKCHEQFSQLMNATPHPMRDLLKSEPEKESVGRVTGKDGQK